MTNQPVLDPNWRICVLWKNYKHILDRQLIMGQDLSIGWRGGPSTLPMALHFVALDTNDEALHLFQMNQHLNYLLQNLMGRTILKFPFF